MTSTHHPDTAPRRPERATGRTPRPPMRTDIQALRGLAVAAVLGYHFAPAVIPGGYVGVDIFFVISGFVITTLMMTELRETGRLSFSKFYARRARRILPAATATITLTVLAGLVLLPLNRWESLASDALFTALFGQNWHLAAASVDYLGGGGLASPMQHFWSLSIEEQFYFLWPVLLIGAYGITTKLRPRPRPGNEPGNRSGFPGPATTAALAVLIPVLLLSFAASAAGAGSPAAYFTSHTRAWQLAVGALLAVCWPAVNRLTGNASPGLAPGTAHRSVGSVVLLLGGASLVTAALLTFTGDTPFPGVAALAPTLGTAALIAAGLPAARWVRSRPVQWLGNVSYSLYLVHWPVAVFLPSFDRVPGTWLPGILWAGVGLALSLILAQAGFRYVEQGLPRLLASVDPAQLTRRTLVAGAASVLTGILVAGGAYGVFSANVATLEAEADELHQAEPTGFGAGSIDRTGYTPHLPGTRGTAPSRATVREDLPGTSEEGCFGANSDRHTPECTYGDADADATWALVGDSHIDQYLPALAEIAEDHGVRLVTRMHANCPFNTSQTDEDRERGDACRDANAGTITRLKELDPDLILTSNRTKTDWAEDPITGFIDAWSQTPAPIVVIADNPEMEPADGTTTCVVENYPDTDACAIPRSQALPIDHQLRAAAQYPGQVHVVDLTDAYCTEDVCPPVIGNVMVYRDPHHITATYIQTLTPRLAEEVAEIWQNR